VTVTRYEEGNTGKRSGSPLNLAKAKKQERPGEQATTTLPKTPVLQLQLRPEREVAAHLALIPEDNLTSKHPATPWMPLLVPPTHQRARWAQQWFEEDPHWPIMTRRVIRYLAAGADLLQWEALGPLDRLYPDPVDLAWGLLLTRPPRMTQQWDRPFVALAFRHFPGGPETPKVSCQASLRKSVQITRTGKEVTRYELRKEGSEPRWWTRGESWLYARRVGPAPTTGHTSTWATNGALMDWLLEDGGGTHPLLELHVETVQDRPLTSEGRCSFLQKTGVYVETTGVSLHALLQRFTRYYPPGAQLRVRVCLGIVKRAEFFPGLRSLQVERIRRKESSVMTAAFLLGEAPFAPPPATPTAAPTAAPSR
jgi:hypothetical protein